MPERAERAATPADDRPVCSLCGLPAGHSKWEYAAGEVVHRFCCPGCLYVFQILYNSPDGPPVNYRETELYRACLASGLIAAPPENSLSDIRLDRPSPAPPLDDEEIARLAQELNLRIGGMWCTACSWLIEETLRKTAGILDVRVAFLNDLALVRYLPHRVSPRQIMDRISGLGYGVSLFQDGPGDSREKRDLFLRLGISAILSMNIMMISFALYFGFLDDFGPDAVRFFSYPLWIIATPVVFYGGYPILRRAWLGLIHRAVSMDTLIAVGTLSAYFYSVAMLASGSIHLYFDTAAMLVTLVLLGRYIEIQARERVSRGIDELFRMAGGKVRLSTSGAERWVAAESLNPGDTFHVRAGERIPVDARVLSGRAEVDESVVSGESRPVHKSAGDEVTGGSMLLDGDMVLSATRVGPDSFLQRTIALMREAITNKNPAELFADRVTRKLVPGVFLLAAGIAAALLLLGSSGEEAMLRALSVLVITCPCALGIAIPLAKVAAVGIGRSMGILVRDPGALERMGKLDTLLFDKTGTLTTGDFSLRSAVMAEDLSRRGRGAPADGPAWTENALDALDRVAAVEAHSQHFLAKAILRKAGELLPGIGQAEAFQSFDGMGVKGLAAGVEVAVGNRRLMVEQGLKLSGELDLAADSIEAEGATVVFFGWNGDARGFLEFGDTVRPGSKALVSALQNRGMSLRLVSGDSARTTGAVARQLGIKMWAGQVHPSDKMEMVGRLQREGHSVGMVGDGINDAAALARADVGFAAGRGQTIAREASDITLLTEDPGGILKTFALAALTTRIVRQNLFFAFFYNILAVPLAASGVLNPLWAAFTMFAGSLTVIGNSLRISNVFGNRESNRPDI